MTRKPPRRRATPEGTLTALARIWRQHGLETFGLNLRGPTAPELLFAIRMGWCFAMGTGCNITLSGLTALGELYGRDLIAEWIEQERARAAAGLGFWEAAA